MRASATLVVGVVAVALAGCASRGGLDARVARAVEREERELRGQVVLASYRDVPDGKELTQGPQGSERPVPPAGAEASAVHDADSRWAAPFGSLSFSTSNYRYFGSGEKRDPDDMGAAIEKLQTWPFRKWALQVDGHPVKPKWTIKGKQLVLNIRIPL
jgi:hypothetical protein